MSNPLHHISIRQRVLTKGHHPFPSKKKFIKLLDYWIIILGPISSLSSIPQIWAIWSQQDAGNVSFTTWATFTLWSITMLVYGVVHDAKSILYTYILATIFNTAIIVGIILY